MIITHSAQIFTVKQQLIVPGEIKQKQIHKIRFYQSSTSRTRKINRGELKTVVSDRRELHQEKNNQGNKQTRGKHFMKVKVQRWRINQAKAMPVWGRMKGNMKEPAADEEQMC